MKKFLDIAEKIMMSVFFVGGCFCYILDKPLDAQFAIQAAIFILIVNRFFE